MYTTLKFIHVMAAIVWIGAGFALAVVSVGLLRARDYAGAAALGRQTEAFGKRVFGPSALITLLAGIGMVLVGDLSWGETWITVGLTGVALSFVFGAVLGERASRDLRTVLSGVTGDATATIDDAEIAGLRRRLALMAGVDLLILTIVVWAMVAKP
ncbi:MAG TPA: DUF2269 family protein [Euzebyales bacterium]|nr:DUF2269 family protein [Euzebyales bacterium]